jgi:hypothetical protein
MRKITGLLAFLLFYSVMQAQVGIGTTTPSSSAQLDVQSTDKGMLVPFLHLPMRSWSIIRLRLVTAPMW